MTQDIVEHLYRLMHMVIWVHTPGDHRWMLPIFALVLVVAPTWLGWQVLRTGWVALSRWQRRTRERQTLASSVPGAQERTHPALEQFVLRTTAFLQVRVIILSLLVLPISYILLLLPKYIVNYALADGGPPLNIFGIAAFDSEILLFLLCAGYLLALIIGGLIKYTANVVRGQVNERIVRRIRLAVVRRQQGEECPRSRSTLAAVAIQECEPIGYFGGSLLLVPLIQGGTLLTSLVFLFVQDVALAFAALIMLPFQIAVLPRLQQRINDKVRERVYITRALNTGLAHDIVEDDGSCASVPNTRLHMHRTREIERVQVEIAKLKAQFKSLYNFTTNLTPFFFFTIGGYLVLQQRLSLGALVAALAAYREIAPALRELFDFARNWSDARIRYTEIIAILQPSSEQANGVISLSNWKRGTSMTGSPTRAKKLPVLNRAASTSAACLLPVALSIMLLASMETMKANAAGRISDEVGDVAVIDAAIDPAKSGAYTDLHGRLENHSTGSILLRRVEMAHGERGNFDLHAGSASIHSASLAIGPDDQVSFDGDRFRVRTHNGV